MNYRTLKIFTMLAAALFAASIQCVSAAEPMSKAQLAKIIALIANYGNSMDVGNKKTTDALGITETREAPIVLRGIAARDDGGVLHQFSILPAGKGYICGRLIPGLNSVYWTDQNLKLIAAAIKASGQPTTRVPIEQARNGLRGELLFFAKLPDELAKTEKKK